MEHSSVNAASQHLGKVVPKGWLLNLAAVPFTLACMAGFLVFALNLPHHPTLNMLSWLWVIPGVIVVFSLHELIHALAAMWRGKVRWTEIKFGFNPKYLIVYCHCRRALNLATYRFVILAPLITLGPLSVALVAIYPAEWLAVTAAMHLAGCIGDIWIMTLLRIYPRDSLVLDHPTDPGCDVYTPDHAIADPSPVNER